MKGKKPTLFYYTIMFILLLTTTANYYPMIQIQRNDQTSLQEHKNNSNNPEIPSQILNSPVKDQNKQENMLKNDYKESIRNNQKLLEYNTSSEEKARVNTIENGDFNDIDQTTGLPNSFSVFMSGYSNGYLNSTENPHTGTYAMKLMTNGTQSLSSTYAYVLRYSFGATPYINQSLNLEFWEYTEKDVFHNGEYSYLQITTRVNTNYYYLYYYLHYNQNTVQGYSNSSNRIYYLRNQTINTWNHIMIDITSAVTNNFGVISDLRVYQIQYFQYSRYPSPQVFTTYLDDFSMTNSTSFEFIDTNNGFEDGVYNGNDWWIYGKQTVPKIDIKEINKNKILYLEATRDKDLASSISLSKSISNNPVYASLPVTIDFSWKINSTENGGLQQYSSFRIFGLNGSTYYTIYYYLDYIGSLSSLGTNTSSYIIIQSPNAKTQNTWVTEHINLTELLLALNLDNIKIQSFYWNLYTGSNWNSSIQMLLDNISLYRYPCYDASFELEGSTPDEFKAWYTYDSGTSTVKQSSIVHSGNKAMNLSISGSSYVATETWTYFNASKNLFTDFYYYVDEITYDQFYLSVEIENLDNQVIRYILMYRGYTWSNSSSLVFLLSNDTVMNEWNHFVRHIGNDLRLLGFSTEIYRIAFRMEGTGTQSSTVFLDDFYFVFDTHAPILRSLEFTHPPRYYEPSTLWIDAYDELSRVKNLTAYYWYPSGTGVIQGIKVGEKYNITFPQLPYGTQVEYNIIVTDTSGNSNHFPSSSSNSSFTIIDDLQPSLMIYSPKNNSILEGTVTVSFSASDDGSGLARIRGFVNNTMIINETLTSSMNSISWNTRVLGNGVYEFILQALDQAGNAKNSSAIYVELRNDLDPPNISNVYFTPEPPQYTDNVTIHAIAFDESVIQNLTLAYSVNNTWVTALMNNNGADYSFTFQKYAYGTVIKYYIQATDTFDQVTYYGTQADPKEIQILDLINPTIFVNGPPEKSEVNGIIEFHVKASDDGSGIDVIILDDSVTNVTIQGKEGIIPWDTTKLSNGLTTIRFITMDKAGNTAILTLEYTVNNPAGINQAITTITKTFEQYAFAFGITTAIILYGIMKLLIRRLKAKKK